MTAPLPAGFRIVLDPGTTQLTPDTWFGGSPARALRLTRTGRQALRELLDGPVTTRAAGLLARRLTDTGLAHPSPGTGSTTPDVTVVIPVRDRPTMLAGALAAVGGKYPVVVVDDGSHDPQAVATVAARHGARLLSRPVNGGPGAARNTALETLDCEFVAFLDSDCVPGPEWIDELAAHFADPLVAAVAPRITTVGSDGSAVPGASTLDLGDQAARVQPNTRVSFVPTAALLVRRAALLDAAGAGAVFDPELRVGEDVDLVWRLHAAGWRIRYDPSVQVGHREPTTHEKLLARRFRYGTSAAQLALRHPGSVPPLVLHPWPALTALALLARRPVVAAAAYGICELTMRRTLRQARIPALGVTRAMLTAVGQTWLGIGHYGTQYAAPLLTALLVAPGGRTPATRWGRRAAAGSLLLGPALTAWTAQRPRTDPLRFVVGRLADDIAYGTGVIAGCLRHRTSAPLRPVMAWRPLRLESAAHDDSAGRIAPTTRK
ncbi:mycofactocin biosynthesis glycosyltransferase MftF [Streptomyces sp. NPDC003393]